ncbi:MAG: 5-oxoprolinase subunit PxpB [Chthoniobacterales bacterium]|nr:5-oxoprolinase subunit PxpB [Chthoniobacterales bacterium]
MPPSRCRYRQHHFHRERIADTLAPCMEIASLGDSALVVRISNNFAETKEPSVRDVLAALRAIEAASIPGVTECTPAYGSVAVFFDPAKLPQHRESGEDPFASLVQRIRAALMRSVRTRAAGRRSRLHEVAVCYDSEFGLDTGAVAQHAGLSITEVVRRHAAAEYHVQCVGFMPGFPYLSGLPRELSMPRRSTPRTEVPAGSVAIGGAQTGIYPAACPGGWNVIGRTAMRLFHPTANPPARFCAGDRVRFVQISRAKFDRAAA